MPPEMVGNTQGTGKQLVLLALACLASELRCHQPYPDPELTDTPVCQTLRLQDGELCPASPSPSAEVPRLRGTCPEFAREE